MDSDNAQPLTIEVHNPSNLPLIDYRTVKPLQGNLKDLTKENYEKLKNVLIKRGFRVPLFLWTAYNAPVYYLMDGHGRHRVMIKEDMRPYEVPYVLIEAKTVNEAKAVLLEISSQYQTITQEGYDEFTAELPELELKDVFFDKFAAFQDRESDTEEDEAPEPSSEEPKSKLNVIYKLGRHRIMCGDSTDFGAVSDLMNGQLADMVFTDPPYNVNWEYRGSRDDKGDPIVNDNLSPEQWSEFVKAFTTNMLEFMKDGAVYYECSGYHSLAMFERWLTELQAPPRQMIVWAKNHFVLGRHATDYHRQHEQIWYGWKSKNHQWYGGHKETDLWQIDKVHNLNMVHSTEKPVALPAKAIMNSSKEGDIVLDLFSGSGSGMIACEQLNRTFFGMEIYPKYVDVIRRRYWKFINGSEEGWEDNTPSLNYSEVAEDGEHAESNTIPAGPIG